MEAANNKSKRDHWQEVVRQWESSGTTQVRWCAEHQINYKTFIYWKQRLKGDSQKLSRQSFVELSDSPIKSSGIKIHRRNFTIELCNTFNRATLLHCLQVMEEI